MSLKSPERSYRVNKCTKRHFTPKRAPALACALDDARDRGEEAVRDGRERLVEVRARVDSARDRDENVQDPGAADVHAHARDRRVAGSDVHQWLCEVLQEKTDREHVLVADADERLRAALELCLQALLHPELLLLTGLGTQTPEASRCV